MVQLQASSSKWLNVVALALSLLSAGAFYFLDTHDFEFTAPLDISSVPVFPGARAADFRKGGWYGLASFCLCGRRYLFRWFAGANATKRSSLREPSGDEDWTCPQEIDIPEFSATHKVCVLGANWKTAKAHGFLIGDSHAQHFSPLLDTAARQANVALIRTNWVCMPLIGTTSIKRYVPLLPTYNETCTALYRPVISYIQQHDDIVFVVVAAAWAGYTRQLYKETPPGPRDGLRGVELIRDGIEQLISKLGASDRRNVVVISDVARRLDLDVSCYMKSMLPIHAPCPDAMFMTPLHSTARAYQDEINAMMHSLPLHDQHVLTVVPQDAQCDQAGCRTVVDDEFIYRDGGHLRMNLTQKTRVELVKEFHPREALEEAVPERTTFSPQ